MRSRSNTWKQIVEHGDFTMETVARVYGAIGYDANGISGIDGNGDTYKEYYTITAPTIDSGMLPDSNLTVGDCVISMLTFTIMTTDKIPKSAKIVIRSRPTNGLGENRIYGEWMEFGTFWIDHRTVNDNLIDIEAYDSMKKANQDYVDNSQSLIWPKTISDVTTRIAEQIGATVDSRTTSYFNESGIGNLQIVTKPIEGETAIDMLTHIGEVIGGNWIITPENKLRFIQLMSAPADDGGYIVDNQYQIITTDQDDNLITGEISGDGSESQVVNNDTLNVQVVCGSITTANKYTITKVSMSKDSDNIYEFGDNSGYELAIVDNPYASAALCSALYNRVAGIEYRPFSITNATHDPAAELGDFIIVGNMVRSIVYNMTMTLDIGFSTDISAPGEDELEEEYPFKTLSKKIQYFESVIEGARTIIEQTQTQVSIIAEDYTKGSTVRTAFALDPTNITLNAGIDSQGNQIGTITFNSGALVVNSNNFKLDKDGILECNGAKINGTFTSKMVEENSEYESKIENGKICFYLNGNNYINVGMAESGYGYAGIFPGENYQDVGLNAYTTNELHEINGGSAVFASKSGTISLIGNSIYVGSATEVPAQGFNGEILDANGNTRTVVNGIIT